jgi:hypothetical protein
MQNNGKAIYQSLLAQTDEEAREDYQYDPRVAMFDSRNAGDTPAEPVVQMSVGGTEYTRDEITTEPPSDDREHAVQDFPTMIEKNYTVIIDSAHRDWTVQPDAYSNIFNFGYENNININGPQTPYYYNNPFVPLAAYETTLTKLNSPVGTGALNAIQTAPNRNPQTFPPGVQAPAYLNRYSATVNPVYGWKLVYRNGIPLHSPQPFSYTDPTVRVFFYPVYDESATRGAQIGIDIQSNRYAVHQYNYCSTKQFSNVTSIRLIRATLPFRALSPYAPNTFSGTNYYPDGFHNKPYLLLNIENMDGLQYGGAQEIQKSFTSLVQGQRGVYNLQTPISAQWNDYYCWDEKVEFRFDPPLGMLSNAALQLMSSLGQPFSQIDNMNVVALQLQTGLSFGKVQFFVSKNAMDSNAYSDNNVFFNKDLEVGDEIAFYLPALTTLAADASATQYTSEFFNALSNGMLVTDILRNDFSTSQIFPTTAYGTSFMAVPKSSNVYTTWSGLTVTTSSLCLQEYASAPKPFMQSRSFSYDLWLPMMNVNAQACFAMGVTVLEPDISKIKGENIPAK